MYTQIIITVGIIIGINVGMVYGYIQIFYYGA